MPSNHISPKDQLAKVIEAQMKGGFPLWQDMIGNIVSVAPAAVICRSPFLEDEGKEYATHVLEALLHAKGLVAAYPGNWCEDCEGPCPPSEQHPWGISFANYAAHTILTAWLSGGAEAAISTAYDLLRP